MSDPLFLILSGRYVGPELVSEFGRLPPSFLPNGTERLLETQVAFARTLTTNIALTLPSDFAVPSFDASRLAQDAVKVLPMDDTQTLPAGIANALKTLGHSGRLLLLFGDTLVTYPEPGSRPDTFATGTTQHLAMWADFDILDGAVRFQQSVGTGGQSRTVVAGFFDFADSALLRRHAGEADDFVDVLNGYASDRPLEPVETIRWLDFGHLHTYHRSRCTQFAARDFNRVVGDGLSVRKAGTPARKIFAEAAWFQNLPPRFRPFVPHFIDLHRQPEVAYETEYLYLPLLSELYCFASLPSQSWGNILASCKTFLELCHLAKPSSYETLPDYPGRFFEDMILGKTFKRLAQFAQSAGLSLDQRWMFDGTDMPSLKDTAESLIALVAPTREDDICLWHGDFHFANIFFDFRSQRVKVVDPRGMLSDGSMTMFGDARYDIAKLTHSTVGMYDLLMAGRYELRYDGRYHIAIDFGHDPERERFVAEYSETRIGRYGCGSAETLALVALLFLSMLPLHEGQRNVQLAILANGLRMAKLAHAAA
ncbi:hypothetical protein [uncultured Enterovirga sp.]|uniref:hypothetical protein n=1 Tax=uncultured Enterovirga sp. TaxID=2026352 RepID=UPI0035C9EEF4